MSDKISALPEIAVLAAEDILPLTDFGTNVTSGINVENFYRNIPVDVGIGIAPRGRFDAVNLVVFDDGHVDIGHTIAVHGSMVNVHGDPAGTTPGRGGFIDVFEAGIDTVSNGFMISYDKVVGRIDYLFDTPSGLGGVLIGTIIPEQATHKLEVRGAIGDVTPLLAVRVTGLSDGFLINNDAANDLTYSMYTKFNTIGFHQTAEGNIGIRTLLPDNVSGFGMSINSSANQTTSIRSGQLILGADIGLVTRKYMVVGYDDTNGYGFLTAFDDAFGARPLILNRHGGGVGIGIFAALLGELHIDQSSDSANIPVVVIDQADISEGFINFIGSDRGVIGEGTNSTASVRVEIGGVVHRLALYADA